MIVRTLVVILLIGLGPIAQAKETSFTGMELAEFLGPVPPDVVHWSRVVSIDFVVYHGVAQPPLSGRVGFYVGGWPDFKPEDGSTIVKDRLGIYPVKWYRKMRANGTIRQTGLVKLDYYWKSDVWIEAARQSDVDQLVAILAKLPTFTKKPEPIPGMPQTALEYYAREIMAIGVFLSSFSILVSIAWLLNRRWHRAGFALARRLFLLSAYVGVCNACRSRYRYWLSMEPDCDFPVARPRTSHVYRISRHSFSGCGVGHSFSMSRNYRKSEVAPRKRVNTGRAL